MENGLISIYINGENKTVKSGSTLSDVLEMCDTSFPFAATIDGVLVTKANYCKRRLADGERIDLVYPMQGG